MKVSFFGPFYGGYCVFELGPGGNYAFVSGPNTNYLWLLARTPSIDQKIWQRFESRAQELGFDTDKLIRVQHSK